MKKNFARYVSLNVLGTLALSCYILADTYFVSQWLGTAGLAALNIAIPPYSILFGVGMMLGMGGGARYALQKATGETEMGNRTFTQTLLMGSVFALVFMLTGALFPGQLSTLLGADVETYAMTKIYLRVLLLCAPFFICNQILIAFVRNDGAPGQAMAAMLTGSLSNVLLDWVFMYLLDWGMFGAVFATCLSPVISMAVLSPFFLRRKNQFHPVRVIPKLPQCGRILAIGCPAFITELSNAVVIIAFNALMFRFAGNTGVAAYGVIANLSLVVTAVFNGIAQGVQPLVSRSYGEQNLSAARKLLVWSLVLTAVLFAGIYAGLFCNAAPVAELFNKDHDPLLRQYAASGIRLYFLGSGFAGANIIIASYLACTEKPMQSNTVSLLRGLVLILPMSFLLSALWQMNGLWLAYPVTEVLTAIIAIILCKSRKGDGFPLDSVYHYDSPHLKKFLKNY